MAEVDGSPILALTREQRGFELLHEIEPGFIHRRKILALVGPAGKARINSFVERLPETLLPHELDLQTDYIYAEVLLQWCAGQSAVIVREIVDSASNNSPAGSSVVCSTERIGPSPGVWDELRGRNQVIVDGSYDKTAWLEYSTEHIRSTTVRGYLEEGERVISFVAIVGNTKGGEIGLQPVLIGPPALWPRPGESGETWMMWSAYDFYEHPIDDIDEFVKVRDVPLPVDSDPMRHVSEAAFKACLAEILGDVAERDWGGEHSDYFSAHVHVVGNAHTAAFLLKGPGSGFKPMTLHHLGKNGDQVQRLSHEPAGLLVVQHCHEIGKQVRDMLRLYAVQPYSPRRYCFIDGRDSLRLLQAYGLYDKTVELTRQQKQEA